MISSIAVYCFHGFKGFQLLQTLMILFAES